MNCLTLKPPAELQSAVRYLVLAVAATACASRQTRVSDSRIRTAESAAHRAIAQERALKFATIPLNTIAVTPFQIAQSDTLLTPLSYGLADLLMSDLAQSKQVRVVDRIHLDALLRELKFGASGRVDSATAPRVGKLIQARRLVLGAMNRRAPKTLDLDVHFADVVSGSTRSVVNASTSLNDILQAEKELAFRIFNQLNVTLTIAERAAIEQRRTANVAALLAYSRGVRAEAVGDYVAAARYYRQAEVLDARFMRSAISARDAIARVPIAPDAPLERISALATIQINATAGFLPTRPGGGAVDPQIAAITQQIATVIIHVVTP